MNTLRHSMPKSKNLTVQLKYPLDLDWIPLPRPRPPHQLLSSASQAPAYQPGNVRSFVERVVSSLLHCAYAFSSRDGTLVTVYYIWMSSHRTLIPGWFSRRLYRTFTACHSGILSRTSLSIGMHHIYGTKIAACQVGFALVSLIFVINCLVSIYLCLRCSIKRWLSTQGFIVGAILNVWLNDKYGFGKVSATLIAREGIHWNHSVCDEVMILGKCPSWYVQVDNPIVITRLENNDICAAQDLSAHSYHISYKVLLPLSQSWLSLAAYQVSVCLSRFVLLCVCGSELP